jgi:hypothetical protein
MSAPPRVIYIDKFSVVDCLKDIGGDWEYILKSDNDELQAKLTEANLLSVTNIMLTVVPGEDGMGVEVYAKTVSDVENAFTALCTKMEDIEAKLTEAERLNKMAQAAMKLALSNTEDYIVRNALSHAIKELEAMK